MAETSPDSPPNQFPTRLGLASLVAAVLAVTCWPLTIAIGFGMVYVAFALAMVAVTSGLAGIGTAIYCKQWFGIVTSLLGLGVVGVGVAAAFWAMTHF